MCFAKTKPRICVNKYKLSNNQGVNINISPLKRLRYISLFIEPSDYFGTDTLSGKVRQPSLKKFTINI